MAFTELEDNFVDIGGKFYTSAFDLREKKLPKIKAFVFDWDGVFNAGFKGMENSSNFSEVDSLGVNMLRFGFFLAQKIQAKTALITGESNPVCIKWAKRENFNTVYTQAKEKDKALLHFCEAHDMDPENIAYFFDDILDVPAARLAGIKMAVGRPGSPVFTEYIEKNDLADYISGCSGDKHAVREFCELLLSIMDKQFDVIEHRAAYDDVYLDYLNSRGKQETLFYEYQAGQIHSK